MQFLKAPLLLLCFGVYGAFATSTSATGAKNFPDHGVIKLATEKAPADYLSMNVQGCVTTAVNYGANQVKIHAQGDIIRILEVEGGGKVTLKKDGGKTVFLVTIEGTTMNVTFFVEKDDGSMATFKRSFSNVKCQLPAVEVTVKPNTAANVDKVHVYVSEEIVATLRGTD